MIGRRCLEAAWHAYTFVSEDQPDTLARELISFIAATGAARNPNPKKGTLR
ncbi:hypothetical protein ACFWPK_10695 [Nocardia sp. NPDC058519]|uniref:hypothetical protein n=1 Tax=Nocardia sp. NPDC058519 TaxID=3346535 RepID=UPI0036624F57